MNISKDKINIRERLSSLLDLKQVLKSFSRLGVSIEQNKIDVKGVASVDQLKLNETIKHVEGDAVAVFVYDTTRDSDGGAWRKRCGHTSWYNEELNTETRGGRREFPAVAIIVAHARQVTIFDGDDPSLPMWMVFNSDGNIFGGSYNCSCVHMLNGDLRIGIDSTLGVRGFNFVKDLYSRHSWSTSWGYWAGVSQRNDSSVVFVRSNIDGTDLTDWNSDDTTREVTSLDMRVLPGAPTDPDTLLPIPTVAVGTVQGVRVIKPDNQVVDLIGIVATNNNVSNVALSQTGRLAHTSRKASAGSVYVVVYDSIPTSDQTKQYTSLHDVDMLICPAQSDLTVSNKSKAERIVTLHRNNSFAGIQFVDGDRLAVLGTSGGSASYTGGLSIVDTSKNRSECLIHHTESDSVPGVVQSDMSSVVLCDTQSRHIGVNSTQLLPDMTDQTQSIKYDITPVWKIDNTTGVASHIDSYQWGTFNPGHDWSITKGKMYTLEFDVGVVPNATNLGSVFLYLPTIEDVQSQTEAYAYNVTSAPGRKRVTFRSENDGTIAWGSHIAATIGNPVMRETNELVQNGHGSFWTANNATVSYDSTLGWITVDDAADSGNWSAAVQKIQLEPGENYVLDVEVVNSTAGWATGVGEFANCGTEGPLLRIQYPVIQEPGRYTRYFQADSSSTGEYYLYLSTSGDGQTNFKNVSLKKVEVLDHSIQHDFHAPVNGSSYSAIRGNGLTVTGRVRSEPVAPGADLTCYHGFTSTDYLEMPYTGNLDFGTNDFCIMGWYRSDIMDNAQNEPLWNYGTTDKDGHSTIEIYMNSQTHTIDFLTRDWSGNTYQFVRGSKVINDTRWKHWCCVRQNGMMSIYIDGVLDTQAERIQLDITPSIPSRRNCRVGADLNDTEWKGIKGSVALYKTCGFPESRDPDVYDNGLIWEVNSIPTPNMIKQIHDGERRLFLPNAKCTLNASGYSGLCLSHDQATGLTHVGTGVGVDTFDGIMRVEHQPWNQYVNMIHVNNNISIKQ